MKWFLICLLALSPTFANAQEWAADFRFAVASCWNTKDVSASVVVGFQLDRDGRVVGDVTLVGIADPTEAQEIAFQAARRAILRCAGADGYDLPREDYDIWRNVEMAFTLPDRAAGS